jgi:hypothetical protein
MFTYDAVEGIEKESVALYFKVGTILSTFERKTSVRKTESPPENGTVYP